MNRGRALQIKRAKVRRGRWLLNPLRVANIAVVTQSFGSARAIGPWRLIVSPEAKAMDVGELLSDVDTLANRLAHQFFDGLQGDIKVSVDMSGLTDADKAARVAPTVYISLPSLYTDPGV